MTRLLLVPLLLAASPKMNMVGILSFLISSIEKRRASRRPLGELLRLRSHLAKGFVERRLLQRLCVQRFHPGE